MVLGLGFVASNLAVQFVSQLINRSIQISMRAFSKQVAAFDVHIALGALTGVFLFHVVNCQQNFHIDHLVEMPRDAVHFAGDIPAQCRRDFKVMAADRQVHKNTPFPVRELG